MSAEGLEQVSVEDDKGRILSGVGVSKESLQETVDARAPVEKAEIATPEASNTPDERRKEPRGQKRFDQLTGEREDAKRRAEAAEKERDDLKQRLAAAERHRTDSVTPPAESHRPRDGAVASGNGAPADGSHSATRPKPSEDEIGAKYSSYVEFVEDLADWKYEQKEAARDIDALIRKSIEADRASRSFTETIQSVTDRARKVYSDFDAVLARMPKDIPIGPTDESDKARFDYIVKQANAEHLVYAIAKEPALARELSTLSDIEFGLRLSAIAPTGVVASPASTAPAVSAIPPSPYQPVGSGSTTTVLPSAELPKRAGYDFDKSGYREKRAAERGVNRR